MQEPVFPLQTILFQVIFLFVAIALEARVFHQRLRLTRRTSVEYATSLNLLTAVIGWVAFFLLQDFLPQPLRTQLISFIFFDRFLIPQPANLTLLIVSAGITIFFAAFLIKLKGLELLEDMLKSTQEASPSPTVSDRRRPTLATRLNQAALHTDANHATVVLLANAYSHSAILLLLFIRFLQLSNLE